MKDTLEAIATAVGAHAAGDDVLARIEVPVLLVAGAGLAPRRVRRRSAPITRATRCSG
ncbi:hypothetical protein TOK_1716 [Pseudonocardia sp. N23]|nr:hypothetical protein TOK_1716 [Pseudonocardia sp. N23]